LPEEDVDTRRFAHAQANRASANEYDSEIIDLDDELLPGDDLYSESRA
jgi:hypothetical protein